MVLPRPDECKTMSISLQFVSLKDGQEVFMWSDCLLDLAMDFLATASNIVFEMCSILR